MTKFKTLTFILLQLFIVLETESASLLSPCLNNPCKFGTCIPDMATQNGYKCECDEKFRGPNCDIDVNECERPVCGGECRNLYPKSVHDWGYECVCEEGYSGQKCDHINYCSNHTTHEEFCKNGAVCQDGFCACSDGWAGHYCDKAVPSRKYFSKCSTSNSIVDTCISAYGNGKCDAECAREECFYDGMDCMFKESQKGDKKENCPSRCSFVFSNGQCDSDCNIPQCGFDGGDCENAEIKFDSQLLAVTVLAKKENVSHHIRELKIVLARLLHSPFVHVAFDPSGDLVYEWIRTDESRLTQDEIGRRITDLQNLSSVREINGTVGMVVFFDIASNDCLLRQGRVQHGLNSTLNRANCFFSVKAASRFLQNELVRKPESLGLLSDSVKITDVRVFNGQAPSWRYRIYWFLIGILCASVFSFLIYTVIVHLKKQKKRKECYAPIWKIPKPPPSWKTDNFSSFSPPSLYDVSPKKENSTFTPPDSTPVVGYADIDNDPPLIRAVRRCDIEAVAKMISGSDHIVDSVDSQGLGVLHHAIGNNDYTMLKFLLDSGDFDVFEANNLGQIPLVYASRIGHPQIDCYALLIHSMEKRRFCNDSSGGESSDSPFDNRKTLLPLSDEYSVAWPLCDDSGRNAVHYASVNNLHNLIHYLVAFGANPSLSDGKGDTPLHLACKHGHIESVRTLLSCGADLSMVDNEDRTPLQIAMRYGHWEILHYIKSGRITYTPVARSKRIKRPRVISSFVSESDSDYNSFDREVVPEPVKRARHLVVPLSNKKEPISKRGPPLYSIDYDNDCRRYDTLTETVNQYPDSKQSNNFILTPPSQLLGFGSEGFRGTNLPSCSNSPNYYYDWANPMYNSLDSGDCSPLLKCNVPVQY